MAQVELLPLNLFDYDSDSTVAMAGATQDTDFPIENLHDRSKTKVWKGTTDGTPSDVEFTVSNAAFNAAAFQVDRLVIPAGHNLNGLDIEVVKDPDSSAVTVYGPTAVTEANDEDIVLSWTADYHTKWQVIVVPTTSSWVMQIPELHLSCAEEMARNPKRPSGALDDLHNVKNEVTSAGYDRFLEYGSLRRRRSYSFESIGEEQVAQIVRLNTIWAGKRPFWISDHNGIHVFMKLTRPINMRETGAGRYSCEMDLVEVIS